MSAPRNKSSSSYFLAEYGYSCARGQLGRISGKGSSPFLGIAQAAQGMGMAPRSLWHPSS